MGKLNEAGDLLLGMAERFRPLLDVADAIKGIGNLEDAARDRQAAFEAARTAHENQKQLVERTAVDILAARQAQEKELADHKERLKNLEAETRVRSEAMLRDASTRADQLLVEARAAAQEVSSRHGVTMAGAREALSKIHAEIKAATEKRDEIIAHHVRVNKDVEALREVAKRIA